MRELKNYIKEKVVRKDIFMLFLLIIISSTQLIAQTTIYTQNFGTGTSFPSGWSGTGSSSWTISNNTSSPTPTFSGGSNASCGTGTNISLIFDGTLSTVGYTNITVLWAGRRASTRTLTFEWSSNGTSWNSVTYTDVSNNSTWAFVQGGTRINLPTAAEGVSDLRFRWTISNSSGYRIDDFSVQGCQTPVAYSVTGGGSYCSGGSGVVVGLSDSDPGVNYQLKVNSVNTGSVVAGTGTAISFGNQTTSGTYSVVATRVSGGCTNTMSGSAVISVKPLPAASVPNQSNISCYGGADGTITVSASGGTSPYTFSINNGVNYFNATGTNLRLFVGLLANTAYQIKVKDINGCISN